METLRLENQRLKARLTEIALRKSQSTLDACSDSSQDAGRLTSDNHFLQFMDGDNRLIKTSGDDSPAREKYCDYSEFSPLRNVQGCIDGSAYGKDQLASMAFSMDNVGSAGSINWNDSQKGFNKSNGSIRMEASQHSLLPQKMSSAISPPSPASVVMLQSTVSATNSFRDVPKLEEGKETMSDDECTADRNSPCAVDTRRSGYSRVALEPVMEQIVRAVLEDKDASLNTPNCYKVLYRYALAQVEIQCKASEIRLANLKIAKMQREADLQARLLSSSSTTAAAASIVGSSRATTTFVASRASRQEPSINENEAPDAVVRGVETENKSSRSILGSDSESPARRTDEPSEASESVQIMARDEMVDLKTSNPAPSNGAAVTPTHPFSVLLYELIWAIAFTLCLINNLHGPGAKAFAHIKNPDDRNKKKLTTGGSPSASSPSSKSATRSSPQQIDASVSKLSAASTPAPGPSKPMLRSKLMSRGPPSSRGLRPALKQPSG